jgi:peptidoglycan/LPS O-acetylase OafA/YrhL
MTFLGLISYSLYLWHLPPLSAAQALGWLDGALARRSVVVVFVLIPPVLAVSALSYRFVEKPFLRCNRAPCVAGAVRA